MINNYIFDFDGTLVDTFSLTKKINISLAKKYNFALITEEHENIFRNQGALALINSLKIPKTKLLSYLSDVKNEMTKHIAELKFLPHIPQTLAEISISQKIIGVLTSNKLENVQKFFDINNIKIFQFIHSENNLFGKAPILKKIIKKYQFKKSETAYIGDELRDIQAAKKVGITSIAVTWGFNSEKLLKSADPDFIINHPLDILKI